MLSRATACREGGFTLIEIMVSLAIAAILMAAAVPAFERVIQDSRIKTAGDGAREAIDFARLEAIKRNRPVTLKFHSDGHPGWWIYESGNPDPIRHRVPEESGYETALTFQPSSARTIAFDPFGRALPRDADGNDAAEAVDIQHAGNPDGFSKLRVRVSKFGSAMLCNRAAPATSITGCPAS